MKNTMCYLTLFFLFGALAGSGCSSYQLNRKSELQKCGGEGPIRVLTVDSLLYTLERFTFNDSLLKGSGTLNQNGLKDPFVGSIPFKRIVFIEGYKVNYLKGLWVVPVAASVAYGLNEVLTTSSQFEIHRKGGSCPFIYAYDGAQFNLEGEAFGTSISKALEAESFSLLPSLVPVDGGLTVRVGNERPETHLLNSVHLMVADAGTAPSVALDVDNVLWPLPHAVAPVAARDHSGKDILANIVRKDGYYWKSDLAHTAAFSGFRDELEVKFDVPRYVSEVTVVVSAINTELITEVYRTVGNVLGDATMQFYYALEHDPQLQNSVREWIRESSLRIEVNDGASWREVGVMLPEANVAPFARAIRINNLGNLKGPLRLRLSSLTDVWRIDAVAVDFSPVQPLNIYPLNIVSVRASDQMNYRGTISISDSSYALILPSHYIDITFNAATAFKVQRPVYIFAARGYLYEWFSTQAKPGMPVVSESLRGIDKIAMLNLLIRQKDIILPPIYAGWRNVGEEVDGRDNSRAMNPSP